MGNLLCVELLMSECCVSRFKVNDKVRYRITQTVYSARIYTIVSVLPNNRYRLCNGNTYERYELKKIKI